MLPDNRELNFSLRRGGRQYLIGFRSPLLLGLLHSSTEHTTEQRANLFGNAEGKQDHRENKQTESKESRTTVPLLWGGF